MARHGREQSPRPPHTAPMLAVWLALCTLSGCPTPPVDVPTSGSGDGGEAEGPPPIQGSVCERLGGGGHDESSGVMDACPESTTDAIRVEWHPAVVVKRNARSSVFFFTTNLLHEEVSVEYEVTVGMNGGGETFTVPLLDRGRRTFARQHGGAVQADLHLAQAWGVLQEGDVEVLVSARLVAPTQTPMIQVARAVVRTKLDDDGVIYDIDYVDW